LQEIKGGENRLGTIIENIVEKRKNNRKDE
jgi:hypothetical protein